MKSKDFVNKAKEIALEYKTLYVMGCFGSPLNKANKKRFTTNCSYNKKSARTKMINNATADTFGFDCVCLIKGILWGWSGNKNATHGGAKYKSNGVADVNADTIITSTYCKNVSTDFNNIEVGEIVWLKGHVGIYIGLHNGERSVAECSPAWKNGVQITKLSQRNWKKHGKLKYIDYGVATQVTPTVNYYKKYTGKSGSIVNALKSIGVDSSFSYRKKIAKANNITAYVGLPSQNTKMLQLLKAGKLIKA